MASLCQYSTVHFNGCVALIKPLVSILQIDMYTFVFALVYSKYAGSKYSELVGFIEGFSKGWDIW